MLAIEGVDGKRLMLRDSKVNQEKRKLIPLLKLQKASWQDDLFSDSEFDGAINVLPERGSRSVSADRLILSRRYCHV
jgi:hypothetical protein